MKTDNKTKTTIDLPQFISKVKRQDKIHRIIYIPIMVLYFIIIVINLIAIFGSIIDNRPFIEWISLLGTLLPFVIIYFVLRKRYKEYKRADYSQSTYLVLKSMERRYRSFRLEDLWVFAALFILVISLGIDHHMGFLSSQLFYWAFILIGIIVGYIYWYIKIKPLRDKALKMIKELEE